MSHKSQRKFCFRVKQRFNDHFTNKKVLDVGSLDINGNNRHLFQECHYVGIDLMEGKNVDVIGKCHEIEAEDDSFDTIISTECFEHDMYIELTVQKIVRLLKPKGLFVFTCASIGRPEHGTRLHGASQSPFTSKIEGWEDYYRGLTEFDIRGMIDIDQLFAQYEFTVQPKHHDLRFWGIKW